MTDLQRLYATSAAAEQAFLDAISGDYLDRWDFYHACEGRGPAPRPRHLAAHDAWMEALHAFYLARDGVRGFLGCRGA